MIIAVLTCWILIQEMCIAHRRTKIGRDVRAVTSVSKAAMAMVSLQANASLTWARIRAHNTTAIETTVN